MTSLVCTVLAAVTAAAPSARPTDAMPMSVGSGVIHGGWGYVWVAYGIFYSVLALYTVSLFVRTRAANAAGNLKEQA